MANDVSLPSLKLTRSHLACGSPNAGPHSAAALDNGAFAIASGDHIEILDEDLQLQSTLLYSDAFPSGTSAQATITAIAFDGITGRIAAACADRIAIWSKTSTPQYKVHSTLATGFYIECLDLSEDTLIVGGSSLATYTLDIQSGFASWSRRYARKLADPATYVKLAAQQKLVACSYHKHHVVQISRLADSGQLVTIAEPWHGRSVRSIAWMGDSLVTETADAVMRIWRCMPDEADFYVLWHTVNPARASSSPFIANSWFNSQETGRTRVYTMAQDGHVSITELANLDQPATTAARATSAMQPDIVPRRHLPSLRYTHSIVSKGCLSLLGISRGSGLLLLSWANVEDGTHVSLTLRRSASLRPRQPIKLLVASEDQKRCISCGTEGETILWQCRRWRGRAGNMTAMSMYRAETPINVKKAAVSPDGSMALLVHDSDVIFLREEGGKMKEVDVNWSSMPRSEEILAVAIDAGTDGRLHLLVVDATGRCFVWLVHALDPPQLVYTSGEVSRSTCAAIVAIGTNAIKIVRSDEQGDVTSGIAVLDGEHTSYKNTGQFRTQHGPIRLVCSSSTHQVAAVTSDNVLTISNTQASLFTSGLEYTFRFTNLDVISSIAFANTPTGLPILQVVLPDKILILSQQRLAYYKETTLWVPVASIPFTGRYPITASTFVYNATLFVATHNQTYLLSHDLAEPAQNGSTHLLHLIDSLNAPLLDYHPQLLLQLLLNGRAVLADEILSRLQRAYRLSVEAAVPLVYTPLEIDDFAAEHTAQTVGPAGRSDILVRSVTSGHGNSSTSDESERNDLQQALQDGMIPGLSDDERNHLQVVIRTISQVEAQRRALDTNGMRFLVSLRSFAITQAQRPDSQHAKWSSGRPQNSSGIAGAMPPRARLRYRDNLWAFFSESQEILLTACSEVCDGPMTWQDARAFGLPLWIKSSEALAAQMEIVARTEYSAGEDKDPTACSLYYFALRKKRLVQGLWRQATSHKERNVMIKFLQNDFSEPRWKTAALKNAYALIGKHRYAYAAAFFLLGDSLKDAVGVCLRQLDDFHLAVAIARVHEGDDGPVLRDALHNHILPLAFIRGHRRLAIWSFWMLKRRDLAVRVIVTPMSEMAASLNNPNLKEIGSPGQEDTSLLTLYVQLRNKSLQTLRGSSAISPLLETQFVLHNAQTLCRMGCHSLALDLVCRWEFLSAREQILALASPTVPAEIKSNGHTNGEDHVRPNGHHRRRSSLLMPKRRSTFIADVPSVVPSRVPSPESAESTAAEKRIAEEKAGFKKVLKEVKAAPADFDMSAFGF